MNKCFTLKFKRQSDEEMFKLQFYNDRINFIKGVLLVSALIACVLYPGFFCMQRKLSKLHSNIREDYPPLDTKQLVRDYLTSTSVNGSTLLALIIWFAFSVAQLAYLIWKQRQHQKKQSNKL